jgi:hypothetical protein
MPLVLRKIKKAKWYKNVVVPWLKKGELQADALTDLKTTNNRLSVWLVQNDKSNLDRIITALASTCEYLTNIDFALLDQSILEQLDIKWEKTKGDSHDDVINQTNHLDLIELTATKLYQFAHKIQTNGTMTRYLEKKVINLVIEAIRIGRIAKNRLNEKIQRRIRDIHN